MENFCKGTLYSLLCSPVFQEFGYKLVSLICPLVLCIQAFLTQEQASLRAQNGTFT